MSPVSNERPSFARDSVSPSMMPHSKSPIGYRPSRGTMDGKKNTSHLTLQECGWSCFLVICNSAYILCHLKSTE